MTDILLPIWDDTTRTYIPLLLHDNGSGASYSLTIGETLTVGPAVTVIDGGDVAAGTTTDTPSTAVQGATARTHTSLLKGIQNYLKVIGDIIVAVNTARTTGTLALPTQPIDAAGNVLGRTAANTGRTTGTLVDPVQIVGADGAVLPAVPVLGASEAHVGLVTGVSNILSATPTLTVAGAYSAGDFVGTSATPMSFAGASRVNAGTGKIANAFLIDLDHQGIAGNLWLFNATITPPADNAAWTISAADAAKIICIIPFSTYGDATVLSLSSVNSMDARFKTGAGSTTIYGCFVTAGTPTYVTAHLIFGLGFAQD